MPAKNKRVPIAAVTEKLIKNPMLLGDTGKKKSIKGLSIHSHRQFFRISWSVKNPWSYDWVGLFPDSEWSNDDHFIKAWSYVKNLKPNDFYDTIIQPGGLGYTIRDSVAEFGSDTEIRYIQWDSKNKIWKTVRRLSGIKLSVSKTYN